MISPTAPAASAIRKFTAPTSREALRLAREMLGGEALVLANRAVPEGVEIVAMAQEDSAALVQGAQPLVPAETPAPRVPAAAPPLHADSVLSELQAMRSMIEEQLASAAWTDQQRRDPVRGRLLRAMLGAGFSAGLPRAMLERLPAGQSYAQGLAFVKSELIRTIPVPGDEDALLAQGGVYALMGPTGVGKTTTTAKLAARCVMRFGAGKLALVTTDGYRIGAYEQLRIYGQILNVPVYAVKDAASLEGVLQDLRDRHMVLIDTVGMSQRDRAVSDQIAMLCGAGRPVKRLLLLNAASHGDTLNEVVYAYRQAGSGNDLAGCIFTKLDEATHYGAVLDTVIRHRLPVLYVSNGQKVPENLMTVDREQLVEGALQARSPGGLFACPADLPHEPARADASAAVASAQAQAERLRRQYQQLIRAMAHDAQEVAVAAGALQDAGVGFGLARRLWRQIDEQGVGEAALLPELVAHTRADVAAGCEQRVLAVCGRIRWGSNDSGDGQELPGSLLLSDRTGQPFAAPCQWPAPQMARKPGSAQIDWLRQCDFGKPLVYLLPGLPALEDVVRWEGEGRQWSARAPGAAMVIDPRSGAASELARLEFEFGPQEPVSYRGKAALRADAQAQVLLRSPGSKPSAGAACTPALRCVATRIVDARSGRLLERRFLLSNIDGDTTARQLSQWQEWAARVDPCFRLVAKGFQLTGGIGETGDSRIMKRLLIAGQVATTVWRLLHLGGQWASRARVLLAELTGRQVRLDRPFSGNVLYEGLGKLFHLLDALETETAPSAAAPGQDPVSSPSRSLT